MSTIEDNTSIQVEQSRRVQEICRRLAESNIRFEVVHDSFMFNTVELTVKDIETINKIFKEAFNVESG